MSRPTGTRVTSERPRRRSIDGRAVPINRAEADGLDARWIRAGETDPSSTSWGDDEAGCGRRVGGVGSRRGVLGGRFTPAAVGSSPTVGELFDLPTAFFVAGRPYARLERWMAHFRRPRRTPARERDRALAFTEQIWELSHALERHVELPTVDLPGFSAGENDRAVAPVDPVKAARELRRLWGISTGPIPHMVGVLEQHGIVVTLTPFAGAQTATVDAYSTSHLPRPVVVLTPDRAEDVYRHRFTAAHELGHLLLHRGPQHGNTEQELEADQFAAEFLTPGPEIRPRLSQRMDWPALGGLSAEWGVSVTSLIYRCREVGVVSEAACRRTFQRRNRPMGLGHVRPQSEADYHGEVPTMLSSAVVSAEQRGISIDTLAGELCIRPERVRTLVGSN